MKKKTPEPVSKHPFCAVCRDGTYAVISLQTFPEEGEWSHYCDRCGQVMASVVRESQKRDPLRRSLPSPPRAPEPEKPKAPEKLKAPEKPKAPEGHDLLSLMGWKR